MGKIDYLEPRSVFYYFEKLCEIPHGSGNVDQISDYLVSFAKEHDLYYKQDETKNVIIVKEASTGYEKEEPVIIQGHMDMVAVKTADCEKDMKTEGLDLMEDGTYIYADKTSLGGDDGIAVAYALAILADDKIKHPRLECIFTVDEETGMEGAFELSVEGLQSKRLLNIDSEEEGILLVSCAGGARFCASVKLDKETAIGEIFCITVDGLAGGHSGVEINKGRVNAAHFMDRVLLDIMRENIAFRLIDFNCGFADNAIPRKAEVKILVEDSEMEKLQALFAAWIPVWKKEMAAREPELTVTLDPIGIKKTTCCSKDNTAKICRLLAAIPNGIMEMSKDIEGLVETSLNTGIVKMTEDQLEIHISVRSSIESAKTALLNKLSMICELADVSYDISGNYPGWAYRQNSPLRDKMIKIYQEMFGNAPQIEAIHAGLECGLFADKIEDLDCVSFGPNILDIHTTEERLEIASVKRCWEYILEILKTKD